MRATACSSIVMQCVKPSTRASNPPSMWKQQGQHALKLRHAKHGCDAHYDQTYVAGPRGTLECTSEELQPLPRRRRSEECKRGQTRAPRRQEGAEVEWALVKYQQGILLPRAVVRNHDQYSQRCAEGW